MIAYVAAGGRYYYVSGETEGMGFHHWEFTAIRGEAIQLTDKQASQFKSDAENTAYTPFFE